MVGRVSHFLRWVVWHGRFAWQALLQREFEDERVQRLVRQHLREFWRG